MLVRATTIATEAGVMRTADLFPPGTNGKRWRLCGAIWGMKLVEKNVWYRTSINADM